MGIQRYEEGFEKVIIEKITMSLMTCESCGYQETVRGRADVDKPPRGWYSLTTDGKETDTISQKLICRSCHDSVRIAVRDLIT